MGCPSGQSKARMTHPKGVLEHKRSRILMKILNLFLFGFGSLTG